MTPSDLSRLAALAEAATGGTWRVVSDEATILAIAGDWEGVDRYVAEWLDFVTKHDRADAEYIVAAVNAVPALVQRVRELEAERERLTEALRACVTAADRFAGWQKIGFSGALREDEKQTLRELHEQARAALEAAGKDGAK